jgi:hypothetical protein
MRPRRFCSCSLAAAQEGEVELMRNGSRVRKNLYVPGDKHGLNWIDTTIQLIRHHVAPSVCMHGIGIETKIGQRCACLHMCIPTSKVPVRPVDSIDVILATHATSVSVSLSSHMHEHTRPGECTRRTCVGEPESERHETKLALVWPRERVQASARATIRRRPHVRGRQARTPQPAKRVLHAASRVRACCNG